MPRLFQNNGENILDPEIKAFIEKLVPTSGISMDIALSHRPYKGRSLLHFEDPDAFGIFISNVESSIAPRGKLLMTVFAPVRPEKIKDKVFIQNLISDLREKIFKMYPKLKENIEFERNRVHEVVDNTFVNTYQYKDIRPKTRIPGIDNCFLIGDYLGSLRMGRRYWV